MKGSNIKGFCTAQKITIRAARNLKNKSLRFDIEGFCQDTDKCHRCANRKH